MMFTQDYRAYVDYMDLAVCCPQKSRYIYHSLAQDIHNFHGVEDILY